MGAHASSLLRDGDTPEEPTVAASELEGAGVVFDHVAFAAAATDGAVPKPAVLEYAEKRGLLAPGAVLDANLAALGYCEAHLDGAALGRDRWT